MGSRLGAVITMPAVYRDKNGVLFDPSPSPVLTITKPDGSTSSPALVHNSTGNYSYDYDTIGRGYHSWDISAPGFGSIGDSFNIDAPTDLPLVSLTVAKEHIKYGTSTTDDEEIRDKVAAATNYVNSNCGYCLPTTIRETIVVPQAGMSSLILTQWPVISVESITPNITTAGVPTPDVTKCVIDPDGIIQLSTGLNFYGSYTVTYTVGRQDTDGNTYVPDDLQEMCLEYFKWLWETQRGAAFSSSGTPGFSEDDGAVGTPPMPPRVAIIQADYDRPHV